MARVKKNDLVKLVSRPAHYFGLVLDWENGLVVKGPYEESVSVTEVEGIHPVNLVALVCDVMADGKLYSAIPLDLLVRQ